MGAAEPPINAMLGLLLGRFDDLGSGQMLVHPLSPRLLHVERQRFDDARSSAMTDAHGHGYRLGDCAFPLVILH